MLIIKTIEGFKQVVAPDVNIYEYAAANGGTVMDDSEFVELPRTEDQIKADIAIQSANLRSSADYSIRPLQDAVDIDEATPAESALLKKWKRYRVDLNRLSEQAGYPEVITWPTIPT
ncbi:tail fiber assembly protein [Pseudomonas sp. NPDC099000]|uniref:tail fiber assembly protein n=1 Tax=Pseudomonas sp. NPDC099000 TaxID=3364488 RepID=UPI00383A422B